jgi:phage gpG-like protein
MPFIKALKERERNVAKLNQKLAPLVVGFVQGNMNGPFKPNAPLTKSLKNGGSRPLIDSGDTRASISSQPLGDGFEVGTNKPHARILNDGGTIKPKRSRKLAIPTTKQLKKRSDAWGVKKTLTWLESQGWRIFFRVNSIMGRAPPGAKGYGLKIKSKHNKNARKKRDGTYSEGAKGVFYVLYYRSSGVKVPARRFMYLSDEQEKLLIKTADSVINGRQ